jgi:hypothetical protein
MTGAKKNTRREPKGLAEIAAAYESSTEDSKSVSTIVNSMADVAERYRERRAASGKLALCAAEAAATLEEARLDAEKAARMRVVVESE